MVILFHLLQNVVKYAELKSSQVESLTLRHFLLTAKSYKQLGTVTRSSSFLTQKQHLGGPGLRYAILQLLLYVPIPGRWRLL